MHNPTYKVRFTSSTGKAGISGSGLINVDTALLYGILQQKLFKFVEDISEIILHYLLQTLTLIQLFLYFTIKFFSRFIFK